MNRRHAILMSGLCITLPARASVVLYMAAIDSSAVAAMEADRRKMEAFLLKTSGPSHLYLDKAWDGLHWVLTGKSKKNDDPLSHLILAGRSLAVQLPYGKPRLHTPQEVRIYRQLLDAETEATLRSRFDPEAMDKHEVHPEGWADDPDDGFAYIMAAFRELRTFIARAADAGQAVICSWT
jgi:hypothetical protein